jgi:hypothetical protein
MAGHKADQVWPEGYPSVAIANQGWPTPTTRGLAMFGYKADQVWSSEDKASQVWPQGCPNVWSRLITNARGSTKRDAHAHARDVRCLRLGVAQWSACPLPPTALGEVNALKRDVNDTVKVKQRG